MPAPEKVRFGPFAFDPRDQRLTGPEGEVPLNPKSAAVLAYLVERPGRIVPKEELLEAVWGDTRVTDDAVVQRILDIRKALGDNSKTPRFIRTHTRRGYEFLGVAGPEPARPAPVRPRRWRWIVPLAAGVAAAALLAGLIVGRRPSTPAPQRITQLTFLPGMEDYPVFDPAGRRILFASDEGGRANLWILDRDTGERHQITYGATHVSEPDWAPGGEWIAYRSEEAPAGIWARSLVTGETVRVAEFGHHPRWSPDGAKLAFHTTGGGGDLYVWTAAGRSLQKLDLTRPPLANRSRPVWSGDGRHLYFVGTVDWNAAAARGMDSRHWVQLGHQIWRVPAEGGEAKVATPGTGVLRDGGFDLDRWRSQLIFVGVDRSLWRSTVDAPSGEETGRPVRLTLTTQAHQHPRVNRQGEIVFSALSAPESLWLIPWDGEGGLDERRMERVTMGAASARGPALSPDRRRIAYFIWQGERFELWLLDLATRGVRAIGPDDGLSRTSPVWSRDGRWLAYTVLEGRHRELRVAALTPDFSRLQDERPAVTGAGKPVSQLLAEGFDVSADGRLVEAPGPRNLDPGGRFKLAVRSENRVQTLWLERSGKPSLRLLPPGHYLQPSWTVDGRTILYQTDADGWFNIWALPFDPQKGEPIGQPRQVSRFKGSPYLVSDSNLGYAVLKDGVVAPLRENLSDLWLIRPAPSK